MSIPTFRDILPVFLQIMSDGQVHTTSEMHRVIPEKLAMTQAEIDELLPSGNQTVIKNRIGWAKTYLSKACLIEAPQWGHYVITQRGRDVLKDKVTVLSDEYLLQFPEFEAFLKKKAPQQQVQQDEQIVEQRSPEEKLEAAFEELNNTLSSDLLDVVKNSSPAFFEKLVVDLLLKMGYGGSRKDAGQTIGKSGDEGIDGIIREDRLGLDIVYIQAKRWQGTVGRPEIQKFAGALLGKGASKGIFITTGTFSKEAEDYARSTSNHKIVLIDGNALTDYMIEFNVGVAPAVSYEVKKIDNDYFEQ